MAVAGALCRKTKLGSLGSGLSLLATHKLLSPVVRQLERFSPRGEHDENLRHTSHTRCEGNGASVGRKMGVINWLVPVANLGDFSLKGCGSGELEKVIKAIARCDEKLTRAF